MNHEIYILISLELILFYLFFYFIMGIYDHIHINRLEQFNNIKRKLTNQRSRKTTAG